MAQELTFRTNQTPTMWNKEMVIGLLLANLPGAILGGLIGKQRIKRENAQGKIVGNNPGFWNKDALLGGLLGLALGGVATFLAAATGVALTAVGAGAVGIPLAAVALLAGTAISTAAGTYIGGKIGQNREAHEYAEALQQQMAADPRLSPPSPEPSQEPTINFAQQVAQERERTAQQGRTV